MITSLLLMISCSHHEYNQSHSNHKPDHHKDLNHDSYHNHQHDSFKNDKEKKIDWKHEHVKLERDFQQIETILTWYKKYINNYLEKSRSDQKLSDNYMNTYESYRVPSSIQAKKTKLLLTRLKNDRNYQHAHFLEDHEKTMLMIKQLESYKLELESHEGHNH